MQSKQAEQATKQVVASLLCGLGGFAIVQLWGCGCVAVRLCVVLWLPVVLFSSLWRLVALSLGGFVAW